MLAYLVGGDPHRVDLCSELLLREARSMEANEFALTAYGSHLHALAGASWATCTAVVGRARTHDLRLQLIRSE